MMFLIFLNGIIAGLSGCTLLIFPVLSKLAKRKQDLLSFLLGFWIMQYFIFVVLSLITQLSQVIAIAKGVVQIVLGLFLFYLFYLSFFKHKELFLFNVKSNSKSFLYGLSFGLAVTSCSLGFVVASVGLSSSIFISGFLFTLGLMVPLLILGLVFHDVSSILKLQKFVSRISNYFILLLSYYFVYLGFNQLRMKELVRINLFYFMFFIWLFIFIILVRAVLVNFKKHKTIVSDLVYLSSLLVILVIHCISSQTCLVCTLNNFICDLQLLLFFIFTLIWAIFRRFL